jgi:polar amino acid transport system substrate-binding protein
MRTSIFAALLLVGSLAQAQVVSLVSGDDYLPYADRKLPEGGMATELVKKAFAEVKMDVKLDWQPWARGYDETKQGNFAGTFPYFKSAEREKEMIYSDIMIKLVDRVFTKAGAKKFTFADAAGFAGSSICVPIGWAQPATLAPLIKSGQIKLQSPKDISTCVKLVEADRVDFFVTEEANGKASIAAAGVAPGSVVLASAPPVSENGLYFVASRNVPASKDLVAAFNKGLDALRKNGTYDKVIKAHSK